MKDYLEETKIGPTENKKPATLHLDHHHLPGSDSMAPGDRVKLTVDGHVHSNHASDEFGPGHVEIHAHSITHSDKAVDNPVAKKNASTMRMDELKHKIKSATEKDEDMEGHTEDGIKEEGKDEVGKDAHND
jgi:hypothetical protein